MSYMDIESFWKEHQTSLKQIRKKLGKVKPSKVRIGSGTSVRSGPTPTQRRTASTYKPKHADQSFKHFKPKRVRVVSGSSSSSTPENIEHPSPRKTRFTTPDYPRKISPGNSHPPFGKYRKSPPAHLSRLERPASDEIPRGHKLRGSKYEVIPPLVPKKAFERKKDYDSWGEDSGNESDDEQVYYMPHQLPMAFKTPPTVVYGAPFPVYYPPPPKGAKGGRGVKKKKKERRYKDVYEERRSYNSKRKSKARSKVRSPLVSRKSVPPPRRPDEGFDTPSDSCPTCITDYSDDEKPKYQYIFAGHNTFDPYGEEMDDSPAVYLVKRPKFASDYVDWFIEDCLLEELVPDILIEIYDELDEQAAALGQSIPSSRDDPERILRSYYKPTLQVCEDFLGREVDKLIRRVVSDTVNSLADDAIMAKIEAVDPLIEWLDKLLDDTIYSISSEIVKECAIEMADEHLNQEYMNNILDDIITDHIVEIGPTVVDDAAFEHLLEKFIEEEVIKPEVEEDSRDVSEEVIKNYDNKIIKREFQAVSKAAQDKLADSLCLEYLLSTIARQGHLWTESDYASRNLDNTIVNVLIEQFMTVLHCRDKTLNNKPLKKLHQKVVTDVALDVLLQKLSASLDEDVADVDEYERGVLDEVNDPL